MKIIINNGGCMDDDTKRYCIYNGEVCDCAVYSGDPKRKIAFQSKE